MKIRLALPYINEEQQRERTSGRHCCVDQSGISTAIRKAKAYLAQLYINRTVYQQRSAKRPHIWRSCISTAISNANPLRHNRAREFVNVFANRKYSWRGRMTMSRISTETSD